MQFTILLQIQHETNFLPTSERRQAKVSWPSWYLNVRLLHLSHKLRKCLQTRRHLGSGRKTLNRQGYSELREPIKTRENCYSLIW